MIRKSPTDEQLRRVSLAFLLIPLSLPFAWPVMLVAAAVWAIVDRAGAGPGYWTCATPLLAGSVCWFIAALLNAAMFPAGERKD